ncbi:response regulator [bacterium]|nr:response regulator [bacterium]RQV95540.1 MAG: response regulator [bacterium]
MNRNVMIVDDDPSILYTVKRMLESADMTVTTASNGRICLEELKKGFKGLILMDIIMPDMDGWDTVKEIVDQGFLDGIIICMLTGKKVPDQKMDKLKEYILDYITKPLQKDKFVSIVEEYLSFLK